MVNKKKRIFLLFNYYELIVNLVKRNLKVRYKGSFLGFLWSFINPLSIMVIYSLVFSKIMRVETKGIPYSIFFFTGLIPWIFISSTISISINAFLENGSIIKKIFLPLEIVPFSVVISNLVNLILSFIVLVFFLMFFKIKFTLFYLLLPIVVIIEIFVALGLSFIFSTLNVFFRDIANMIEAIILSWFFLSPIVYPAEIYVPRKFDFIYHLNPISGIIEMYRNIFFNNCFISKKIFFETLFMSSIIFMIGIIIFLIFYKKITEEV